MKMSLNNFKRKFSALKSYLPYGLVESWDDLNPRLYHAVHIYWLKFYGMWYHNFEPYSFCFWLNLTYTILVLWLVCFLPGIGEIVYLLRRKENIGDIAEGLYLFLSEMYTYFKIVVFWINKKKILNLLKFLHCDEFKPEEREHREILRKSIKTSRFVMTYYSTICVGAVSGKRGSLLFIRFYLFRVPLKPFLIFISHLEDFLISVVLIIRFLAVGIVLPLTENFEILPTNVEYPYVDVYANPTYGIVYLHHIYYKPATCIIDGVMDTILAAFVASAIGQIEILAYNLRNFENMAERKRKRDLRKNHGVANTKTFYIRYVLKKSIIHYNTIIRYVSMIESAFSLASALQFMLSVMVLCLVGIQFLSIEDPRSHPIQIIWMAIYLTCMLIEVFILCWFGNELILKSLELRQAAFEGPWLKTDPKTTMFIVIFLERCKRPLRVTAGKIFTLSLDTYTYLINWSYKAFAVMRNMKK